MTTVMSGKISLRLGALLLLGQLVLSGCGANGLPTTATPDAAPGGELMVQATTLGTSSGPVSSGEKQAEEIRTIPAPSSAVVLESAALVLPGQATKIACGAFSLELPLGALSLPLTLTLRDVSGPNGRLQCELLPHGIQFLIPVKLTVTIPEGYDPTRFLVFYVQNEGSPEESWLPQVTRVGEDGRSIVAWLNHFSTYAPGSLDGKAGWGQIRRGQKIDQIGK